MPGEITVLLHQWRAGSREAEDELFRLVQGDLRRLARYLLRGERQGHSLQATELVDELYFRLVRAKDRDWESRRHFFAIAARAMRRQLIDHARGRPALEKVALDEAGGFLPAGDARLETALTVDRLLEQLAAEKPEWVTLVEVKYFLGLTDEEAADALGMKLRTMQRMWLEARKYLFAQMEHGGAAKSAGR